MTKLDEFTPYLLRRVLSRIEEAIANDLLTSGMSPEKWRVLIVLSELGHLPLNQLSVHVSINISTLSRLIDRMIEEGLILREPSGVGRAVKISATDLGLAKMQEIEPMIASLRAVARDCFSAEEFERFHSDVRRLYEAYDRFAAEKAGQIAARRSKIALS